MKKAYIILGIISTFISIMLVMNFIVNRNKDKVIEIAMTNDLLCTVDSLNTKKIEWNYKSINKYFNELDPKSFRSSFWYEYQVFYDDKKEIIIINLDNRILGINRNKEITRFKDLDQSKLNKIKLTIRISH